MSNKEMMKAKFLMMNKSLSPDQREHYKAQYRAFGGFNGFDIANAGLQLWNSVSEKNAAKKARNAQMRAANRAGGMQSQAAAEGNIRSGQRTKFGEAYNQQDTSLGLQNAAKGVGSAEATYQSEMQRIAASNLSFAQKTINEARARQKFAADRKYEEEQLQAKYANALELQGMRATQTAANQGPPTQFTDADGKMYTYSGRNGNGVPQYIDSAGNIKPDNIDVWEAGVRKPIELGQRLQSRVNELNASIMSAGDVLFKAEQVMAMFQSVKDRAVNGVLGQGFDLFNQIIGQQGEVSTMRQLVKALLTDIAINRLPKGAASNADIKLVMGTVPSSFTNITQLADWLNKLADVLTYQKEYRKALVHYIYETGREDTYEFEKSGAVPAYPPANAPQVSASSGTPPTNLPPSGGAGGSGGQTPTVAAATPFQETSEQIVGTPEGVNQLVTLPVSGDRLVIEGGLSAAEAADTIIDYLRDRPKYAEDLELILSETQTSGIGEFIGGILGTMGGMVAGSSVAPGPGTFLGAVAGGGAGSAFGEWVEQKLTGKGDNQDITNAGLLGSLFGALPGVGGTLIKGGVKAAGKTTLGSYVGKGGQWLGKRAFGDAAKLSIQQQGKKSLGMAAASKLTELRGLISGRQTTAAFMMSKAVLDLQRSVAFNIMKTAMPKATQIATATEGRVLTKLELEELSLAVAKYAGEESTSLFVEFLKAAGPTAGGSLSKGMTMTQIGHHNNILLQGRAPAGTNPGDIVGDTGDVTMTELSPADYQSEKVTLDIPKPGNKDATFATTVISGNKYIVTYGGRVFDSNGKELEGRKAESVRGRVGWETYEGGYPDVEMTRIESNRQKMLPKIKEKVSTTISNWREKANELLNGE